MGLEQFEPKACAGGCVAHQAARAGMSCQVLDDAVEQGIVASGEYQAVGEQAAVAGFQHPAVDPFAREHPFSRDFGAGNASLRDQGVDLLLVEVEIFRRLLDVEVAGVFVDDGGHRLRIAEIS